MNKNTPDYEVLLDRYAPLVLRLLWQTVGSRERSEELVGKVFVSLARRRVALDSPRLTRQVIRTTMRRCTSRRPFGWQLRTPPADSDWSIRPGEDPDQGLLVLSLVGLLPINSRCAVYLHDFEERSCEEIAPLLGCSAARVERELARGRALFQGVLGQPLDGDNIQAYRTAMTRAPVPSLAWRTRTLEAMERTFPLPGLSILLR